MNEPVYQMKTTTVKGGKEYIEVVERVKFFHTHPRYSGWSILTEMVYQDQQVIIFKATICDQTGAPRYTGHAREIISDRGVNADSHVENCETSAIGRAMASAGIGIEKGFASYDEIIAHKAREADRISPPKDQSSPSSPSMPQATQKGAAALKSILTQGVAMVEESAKHPKDEFIHWSRLNDLNSKYSASDDQHIVQSFKVIREFQQAGSLPALTEMYRRNQEFITRMKDEKPDIYTDFIAAGESCRWILENGLKIRDLDKEYSNRK